jgi:hypothetical protein
MSSFFLAFNKFEFERPPIRPLTAKLAGNRTRRLISGFGRLVCN